MRVMKVTVCDIQGKLRQAVSKWARKQERYKVSTKQGRIWNTGGVRRPIYRERSTSLISRRDIGVRGGEIAVGAIVVGGR